MSKENKLVHGVGINDADYRAHRKEKVNGRWKTIWRCPYYVKWADMLSRCYSKKCQEKYPTYIGCSVCDEWKYFSNFKKWMEQQEWDGRQLDKDFLVENNKVYSPDTCVFLPHRLNSFTLSCGKLRGKFPVGVNYQNKPKHMINELSKPYVSNISNQVGKRTHLGRYLTPQEAHQAYLKAKLKQCEAYLVEFKDEFLIAKGLIRIKNKVKYHIENNLELTSF